MQYREKKHNSTTPKYGGKYCNSPTHKSHSYGETECQVPSEPFFYQKPYTKFSFFSSKYGYCNFDEQKKKKKKKKIKHQNFQQNWGN